MPTSRPKWSLIPLCAAALGVALGVACDRQAEQADDPRFGYTDTPRLPGQQWTVHDSRRPNAPVVEVGRSPTLGLKPPEGATVLFDGHGLDRWTSRKSETNPTGDAAWKLEGDYAEINGTGTIRTKDPIGDMYLHLEFATPAQVAGDGADRGNSGVILMGRYEIQVLDSWDNPTYADGQCAAIYGQFPPLWNASLRPGEWQTFDIYFQAPEWNAEGERIRPAISTVYHNGVLVQDRQAHLGQGRHRQVGRYFEPHGAASLVLQDHGSAVRYRNIWYTALPEDRRVDPQDATTTVPEERRDAPPVMLRSSPPS